MKFYKIMKKPILFLGILIILMYSCKKYEDGPLISLRSPLSRLLGKWEVESVSINGDDITAIYNDSCGCKFSFHSEKHTPIYFAMFECEKKYGLTGRFDFDDKVIKLSIYGDQTLDSTILKNISSFGPFKMNNNSDWVVNRLTNKSLWIDNNYNGSVYLIKLNKYEKDN